MHFVPSIKFKLYFGTLAIRMTWSPLTKVMGIFLFWIYLLSSESFSIYLFYLLLGLRIFNLNSMLFLCISKQEIQMGIKGLTYLEFSTKYYTWSFPFSSISCLSLTLTWVLRQDLTRSIGSSIFRLKSVILNQKDMSSNNIFFISSIRNSIPSPTHLQTLNGRSTKHQGPTSRLFSSQRTKLSDHDQHRRKIQDTWVQR